MSGPVTWKPRKRGNKMQMLRRDFENTYRNIMVDFKTIYHTSTATIEEGKETERANMYVLFPRHQPSLVYIFTVDELIDYIGDISDKYLITANSEDDEDVRDLILEKIADWQHIKKMIMKRNKEEIK